MTVATDLRIEADNRPGQLAAISEELGKVGVNIEGFCAVATDGRGVLHLLVEDAGAARRALEGAGYPVLAERDALVVTDVEDRPGYLGHVAGRLAGADVNIEVGYLATNTRLVFGVDDVETARRSL
ncbi:MAG TPA: hypothetical protein VFZ68_02840 [Acidimicrobiales bacterium]